MLPRRVKKGDECNKGRAQPKSSLRATEERIGVERAETAAVFTIPVRADETKIFMNIFKVHEGSGVCVFILMRDERSAYSYS